MRDPKPGEDYGLGESLLLFGDVLGTGTVANERLSPQRDRRLHVEGSAPNEPVLSRLILIPE